MKGIQRGLPSPTKITPKRFAIESKNNLSKTFTPIAKKSKDRGYER